jgi:hypothetical protein
MATYSNIDYKRHLQEAKYIAQLFTLSGRHHYKILKPVPEEENVQNYDKDDVHYAHK